jgi:adenosine deaminase
MAQALADLHRHLDGSLRLSTLHELAAGQSPPITIPKDIYFHKGMGLEGALACFATTLSVLQSPDAVKRVAREICQDARAEGVSSLEIRFAPQLHKGGSLETIVDAACDGLDGETGLLLCALYGDDPALVEQLVDIGARRPEVVGIDLAGGPHSGHRWSMRDYAGAFQRAREVGLGRTVHAGEGRPAQEIRTAIELLCAQRIGHGTTLLDDLELVDCVLEKGIVIEACPTSNVHTGVIPDISGHPLGRWLELGIKVCLCTDNTLFSQVDARTELSRVREEVQLSEEFINALIKNGHEGRFPKI